MTLRNKHNSFYRVLTTTIVLVMLQLPHVGQTGGTTRYVYDPNGRLEAVVAPNGEAAIYLYDPAGNLVGIRRQTTPLTTISNFTPGAGVVGQTVSIQGTGFSPIANQNTVTFNSTTATVASATETEIVTSVPVGASSGRIRVISPNGPATSDADFTITDLAIGGSPLNVSNTASGQNINIRFYGASGQRLFVRFSNPTFFGRISIRNPDGTVITENALFYFGFDALIDIHTLTQTGVFTIVVTPESGDVGNVTIQASENGALTIGPPDVRLVFSVPDRTAVYSFAGVQDDSIDIFGIIVQESFATLDRAPKRRGHLGTRGTRHGTFFESAGYEESRFAEFFRAESKTSEVIGLGRAGFKQFTNRSGTPSLLPAAPNSISVYDPQGVLLVSVPADQDIRNLILPSTGTYRLEVAPPAGFTGTVPLRLRYGGGGS